MTTPGVGWWQPRTGRRGRVVRSRNGRASSGRTSCSYDARLILAKVWAATGGQCGKYLAASMRTQLDALECHGEIVLDSTLEGPGRLDPEGRYSPAVRAQLLSMSAASLDRYLKPTKAKDQPRGKSTTNPHTRNTGTGAP